MGGADGAAGADKPAANGEGDIKAQMAAVPLKPYVFPDRTGAVGLAEGWTTNAQTESNLTIDGPAGQRIRMAFGGTMYTPDNLMVRQGAGNLPVAKYSDDPATVLGILFGPIVLSVSGVAGRVVCRRR